MWSCSFFLTTRAALQLPWLRCGGVARRERGSQYLLSRSLWHLQQGADHAPHVSTATGRSSASTRANVAGVSQNSIGVSRGRVSYRTYVGGIERGLRNVSILNLLKLAHALEVTLADLVQGIDAPE